MTLTEIHMVAEISGSIFLAVSAVIIIFELHQNLKQRKIQNTFMRAVEDEKAYYKNMEKDFAILVVKAQTSFSDLEEYEKHQFLFHVRLGASILNRGYLMAKDSSFGQKRNYLMNRLNAHARLHLEHAGTREAVLALRERGMLDGYDQYLNVVDEVLENYKDHEK